MKKVSVDELKIGDKVLKLEANWLETPFLTHRFTIKDLKDINKLKESGVKFVYIEPRKVESEIKELIEENKPLVENIKYEELPIKK